MSRRIATWPHFCATLPLLVEIIAAAFRTGHTCVGPVGRWKPQRSAAQGAILVLGWVSSPGVPWPLGFLQAAEISVAAAGLRTNHRALRGMSGLRACQTIKEVGRGRARRAVGGLAAHHRVDSARKRGLSRHQAGETVSPPFTEEGCVRVHGTDRRTNSCLVCTPLAARPVSPAFPLPVRPPQERATRRTPPRGLGPPCKRRSHLPSAAEQESVPITERGTHARAGGGRGAASTRPSGRDGGAARGGAEADDCGR